MPHTASTSPRILLLALGALLGALCLALAFDSSPATGASEKSKLIGPVKDRAAPSCPKNCNAFGHVTGFQARTANQKGVHRVKQDGQIVAWSLDLGQVKDKETLNFFRTELKDQTFDTYGGKSVANLAVLKKKKGKKGKFTLGKQSPIVQLDGSMGEKPIFTLEKPLRVQKGRILALTTPTWVTNFALETPGGKSLPSDTKWRASRKSNRCEGEDLDNDGEIQGSDEIANLTRRSKPQVKKGSTRRYGCSYGNAEILYWGYFVPEEKKGSGKKN